MARKSDDTVSVVILLTTVFIPPLGVFLLTGCGAEVIIAICLTILGWFPGLIYAIYLWLQAGGFGASTTAEARIDRVKQKVNDRRAARQNSKARQTRAAPATSVPISRNNTVARSDSVQPQIIESVLQERHGQSSTAREATSTQKPLRRTMREPKQMESIQTVVDSGPTSPAAVVAARTATSSVPVTSPSPTTTTGNAKERTAKMDAALGAKKDQSAVVTEPILVEQTAAPVEDKSTKSSGALASFFKLGKVVKTDEPVTAAAQPKSNPEEDKLQPGKHVAAHDAGGSRPPSAAAPGTPGASSAINPQISTIRAAKNQEDKKTT